MIRMLYFWAIFTFEIQDEERKQVQSKRAKVSSYF